MAGTSGSALGPGERAFVLEQTVALHAGLESAPPASSGLVTGEPVPLKRPSLLHRLRRR